jgi:oxygen tolerance protein BatD
MMTHMRQLWRTPVASRDTSIPLTRLNRYRFPSPQRGRGVRGEGGYHSRPVDLGCYLGFWILCSLLLAVSPALSQDERQAQLKTSVDATTVTIGDVVTVKLSVKHQDTLKIAFPPVGTALGDWTVRSSRPLPPTKLADGSFENTLELRLAAYKTGNFEIPALNIEAVEASGKKEVLASEPIKVAVQSVLTGKQDTLKDLKPQAELEADYKPFLFFLAALAAVVYLVYRVVQYFKRRKKRPVAKPERVRSAEEVAREAIERLLARRLVEQGHYKQFYLELSEIIKRFLGGKLGVQSLERTTEEFTRDLQAVSVPSAQYRVIREFLQECDLVKFAKYRPSPEEVEQIITRSRSMIDDMARESAKPQEVALAQ